MKRNYIPGSPRDWQWYLVSLSWKRREFKDLIILYYLTFMCSWWLNNPPNPWPPKLTNPYHPRCPYSHFKQVNPENILGIPKLVYIKLRLLRAQISCSSGIAWEHLTVMRRKWVHILPVSRLFSFPDSCRFSLALALARPLFQSCPRTESLAQARVQIFALFDKWIYYFS